MVVCNYFFIGDIMAFEVIIKDKEELLDEKIIEDELNENKLTINDKGFSILDLEGIIIEAVQSNYTDNKISHYKVLEHLDSYLEDLYDYALTLEEEYCGNNEFEIVE